MKKIKNWIDKKENVAQHELQKEEEAKEQNSNVVMERLIRHYKIYNNYVSNIDIPNRY